MNTQELDELLNYLTNQPSESEWLEFKLNFHTPEEIGENISALANGASLNNQQKGYLVFGVNDKTKEVTGTTFKAKTHKKGGENLEHWLATRLNPRIDFEVIEFDTKSGKHISLFVVPSAGERPVEFLHNAYIRVGSITRKLNEFPEKAAKIWRKAKILFETEIAKDNLTASEIVNLLSTESYFDLLKLPYPSTQEIVLEKFCNENLIKKDKSKYLITKLGAVLFAKNLNEFESLIRKCIRVIVYKGKNKVETIREQTGAKGYAIGFEGLVDWINSQLPANEEIGKALRKDTRMYPEIAIREIVANALIHQDFTELGFPMIEIYSDRIEISNPGRPLIKPERFIDEYVSRNEKLSDLMRRMGFCEEKGSGLDKVIFWNEFYQLPAINVLITDTRTKVVLYSYKSLNDTDRKDKIRACYQHACLKYVSNEKMTNQSLRERFKIKEKNYSVASRIIRDTINEGLIKEDEPDNKSRKYASYIPFWA